MRKGKGMKQLIPGGYACGSASGAMVATHFVFWNVLLTFTMAISFWSTFGPMWKIIMMNKTTKSYLL